MSELFNLKINLKSLHALHFYHGKFMRTHIGIVEGRSENSGITDGFKKLALKCEMYRKNCERGLFSFKAPALYRGH